MATNLLALGAAYQAGLLPLAAGSIEGAIRLNGVQVAQNLQAFRYGRLWVADPARVSTLVDRPRRSHDEERADVLARLSGRDAHAYVSLLERCAGLDAESRRMLAIRVGELIDYQDARYAGTYVDFVLRTAEREQAVGVEPGAVTHAVIRSLYKLMAYKDEYEVARLHLRPRFHAETRGLFVAPRRVVYHLHPPLLRALGLRRKLRLGPWFTPALRVLRGLRGLRGTAWDAFGHARVRREERQLIGWYRELVEAALGRLAPRTQQAVAEIAALPDRIRGYEEIKLRSAAAARARAVELLAALGAAAVAAPDRPGPTGGPLIRPAPSTPAAGNPHPTTRENR
jgi:indolepyruvate ferredoxin oxidoreductase